MSTKARNRGAFETRMQSISERLVQKLMKVQLKFHFQRFFELYKTNKTLKDPIYSYDLKEMRSNDFMTKKTAQKFLYRGHKCTLF